MKCGLKLTDRHLEFSIIQILEISRPEIKSRGLRKAGPIAIATMLNRLKIIIALLESKVVKHKAVYLELFEMGPIFLIWSGAIISSIRPCSRIRYIGISMI